MILTSKKILFLIHHTPPYHGAAIIGDLIKNSTTINSNFNTTYINLSTSDSVNEIYKKNYFKKFFKFISILYSFFKIIFFNKPNLIFISSKQSGLVFFKDSILIIFSKLLNIKVINYFHNNGSDSSSNCFIILLKKLVFKNTIVLLTSDLLYIYINKYINYNNIRICPYGIDSLYLDNLIVNKKNNNYNLLFLSNLIESKGILILLDACNILNKLNFNFTLNIVGQEADIKLSHLNSIINLYNLNSKVFYLGTKYNYDKSVILNSSDIFILPTFYKNECLPISIIEALSVGLPVISTNYAGVPDIIENEINGILIDLNNLNGNTIANSIIKIYNNKIIDFNYNNLLKYNKLFKKSNFESTLYNILIE
jgi:glycosyltransferase involved in cell wall biosynthesis